MQVPSDEPGPFIPGFSLPELGHNFDCKSICWYRGNGTSRTNGPGTKCRRPLLIAVAGGLGSLFSVPQLHQRSAAKRRGVSDADPLANAGRETNVAEIEGGVIAISQAQRQRQAEANHKARLNKTPRVRRIHNEAGRSVGVTQSCELWHPALED